MKRYKNLLLTMVIGDIWHGSGWNFLIWGGLHGVYLVINQLWRENIRKNDRVSPFLLRWIDCFARPITFLTVILAWVFFRSETLPNALQFFKVLSRVQDIQPIIACMKNQAISCTSVLLPHPLLDGTSLFAWLVIAVIVVFKFPNVEQIMSNHSPTFEYMIGKEKPYQSKYWHFNWEPNFFFALIIGLLFTASMISLYRPVKFLYFNF